jgi:hypothetical protein
MALESFDRPALRGCYDRTLKRVRPILERFVPSQGSIAGIAARNWIPEPQPRQSMLKNLASFDKLQVASCQTLGKNSGSQTV